MLNTKSAKKDEKGIALIFTLIMLSLLLILALSFTMDSMFSQKSAYNAANSSSARFLAEAQLKQVLTLIQRSQANYDDSRVYSVDSSSLGLDTTDMLVEHLPVSSILASTDSSLTGTPKVKWNYIINASDNRIIGRTAFVVIPDDKIPLDSLVDDRVGTTEYPKHNETNNSETRIGKYVSEINVRAAIPTVTTNHSGDIATITDVLNREPDSPVAGAGFLNGKYTGVNWTSYATLVTAIETAPNAVTLSPADETEIEDRLSLVVDNDHEEFWADLDNDTELDTGELFNRFNLTRADWSTSITNADDIAFIERVLLLTTSGIIPPDIDMDVWDGSDSLDDFSDPSVLANYSKGLPWLACFGYDDSGTLETASLNGTFVSIYDRRRQIAANLKDYCDTDSRPTSDVSPTKTDSPNWIDDADQPTFTGNEKTPYINKIGFQIEANQQELENPALSGLYDIYTNISIVPCVELINIYGNNWPTESLTVVIEGSVTIETTVSSDKTKIFS
ncbi:MAG: hypothetical protein KAS17_03740, partial [Victivallaceae bacterium]|nr:hypothetical protein [Victivallaceae bacterium]